jgi:hypothetical protein
MKVSPLCLLRKGNLLTSLGAQKNFGNGGATISHFKLEKAFQWKKGLVFGIYRDFSTDMWKEALERTFRR